jgi:hypothetical protein
MATYTIEISGYGAEVALGKVTEDIYNFWIDKEDELESHAFYDPYEDNGGANPVTDEDDNRWLGYWHETGNVAYTSGAYLDNLYVEVTDEDGNVVWSTEDVEIVNDNKELFTEDTLDPGYYVHAYSSEKGGFFSGEFETDEFDPQKLVFNGTQIMGDTLVDMVHYNDEYIENEGGSTNGKSQGIELFEVF